MPHLIGVIMELYLSVGRVVGLQWFVHHIPSRVVLNMLLQNRVPVYQEPAGTFRLQSDYWKNGYLSADCIHMCSDTLTCHHRHIS